ADDPENARPAQTSPAPGSSHAPVSAAPPAADLQGRPGNRPLLLFNLAPQSSPVLFMPVAAVAVSPAATLPDFAPRAAAAPSTPGGSDRDSWTAPVTDRQGGGDALLGDDETGGAAVEWSAPSTAPDR